MFVLFVNCSEARLLVVEITVKTDPEPPFHRMLYPITGDSPVLVGYVHVNDTEVELAEANTGFTGVLGTKPAYIDDAEESVPAPTALTAATLKM
jgi:hypothetical protein